MGLINIRPRWQAWRHRRRFFSEKGDGRHLGRYSSFDDAIASLPPSKGFDHDGFSDHYVAERTKRVYAFDYPVMFWLKAAVGAGARSILDIGGSIGVHFYAYRRYGVVPENMSWLVCELPATIAVGQRYAEENGAHGLHFRSDLEAIRPSSDIWLCAGVLEFMPRECIAELLGRSEAAPVHILINKLPLHDGSTFVSTQNLGKGNYAPHYVFNRGEFVGVLETAGYGLVDSWEIPERTMELPGISKFEIDSYSGLYFRRRTPGRS
jgi:putative methyltransferase (TIGR04325 family)